MSERRLTEPPSERARRSGFRSGDRRRRHRRDLPALPRPRSRIHGDAARGRRRRGRHVVLEPLPGRPVRLRELHVRLSLLRGALRGVGVAGALRRPARDRALPQPRGRPVRPAPPHPVGHARDVGRVRRTDGHVGRDRRRCHDPLARVDRRDGRAVAAVLPGRSRPGPLPRRVVPHRSVAADARRFRRQARRRDRHGIERRAADRGDRRRGRLADRVPAHGQLVYAAQQPADHAGGTGAVARRLRIDPPHAQHLRQRIPPRAVRAVVGRRLEAGAVGVLRGDVEQPGLHEDDEQLRAICSPTRTSMPSGASSSPARSAASSRIPRRRRS